MNRLEVRCCCQPRKLLGTLPVPDHVQSGQCIVFLRLQHSADPSPLEHVMLRVATFWQRHKGYRLALKAEGVTLEVLRTLVGFEEHKG
jgi:hypothetical protein